MDIAHAAVSPSEPNSFNHHSDTIRERVNDQDAQNIDGNFNEVIQDKHQETMALASV